MDRFNGEIYNYLELQQWLKDKGHHFRTNSDTETIVHLYEEVGFDTQKYLRGMFSFTIWRLNTNFTLAQEIILESNLCIILKHPEVIFLVLK